MLTFLWPHAAVISSGFWRVYFNLGGFQKAHLRSWAYISSCWCPDSRHSHLSVPAGQGFHNAAHWPSRSSNSVYSQEHKIASSDAAIWCRPLIPFRQCREVLAYPSLPILVGKVLGLLPSLSEAHIAFVEHARRQIRTRSSNQEVVRRQAFEIVDIVALWSQRSAVYDRFDFGK